MTKLMTISRVACLTGALAAGAMMVRADIASAKGNNSHQSSDARSTKADTAARRKGGRNTKARNARITRITRTTRPGIAARIARALQKRPR